MTHVVKCTVHLVQYSITGVKVTVSHVPYCTKWTVELHLAIRVSWPLKFHQKVTHFMTHVVKRTAHLVQYST